MISYIGCDGDTEQIDVIDIFPTRGQTKASAGCRHFPLSVFKTITTAADSIHKIS